MQATFYWYYLDLEFPLICTGSIQSVRLRSYVYQCHSMASKSGQFNPVPFPFCICCLPINGKWGISSAEKLRLHHEVQDTGESTFLIIHKSTLPNVFYVLKLSTDTVLILSCCSSCFNSFKICRLKRHATFFYSLYSILYPCRFLSASLPFIISVKTSVWKNVTVLSSSVQLNASAHIHIPSAIFTLQWLTFFCWYLQYDTKPMHTNYTLVSFWLLMVVTDCPFRPTMNGGLRAT